MYSSNINVSIWSNVPGYSYELERRESKQAIQSKATLDKNKPKAPKV